MPLRIVHLSDLHYPSISPPMWEAVKTATIKREPHLIIVSGDLVDDPVSYNLRLVQAELNKLAQQTKSSLHVVAGNHDVFDSGLNTVIGRSDAFDLVFGGNAAVAPQALAAVPTAVVPTAVPERPGMLRRLMTTFRPYQPPPQPPPPIAASMPIIRSGIRQPEGLPLPVLLALFDSNPNDAKLAFAAGEVSPHDLVAVEDALGKMGTPHLLRIAVIHHHVLPIAFSNGTIEGNESLMVLRNAADVLALLARHRFDLVLHGHKHLSQFVRLDFSPTDAEGYPIAVASAGAAALIEVKNKTDSCGLNFIEVADNGRIAATSFTYGYGRAPLIDTVLGTPNIDYRTYEEPFATVARRAFWRARQTHKTWCESRICSFEVTESGDLLVNNELTGLRHTGSVPDTVIRRHVVGIPDHGRLAVRPTLDAASAGRKVKLIEGAAAGGWRNFSVEIPRDNLTGKDGGGYHLHHEVANSMTMTAWEDAERRRVNPPQDWRPERREWVSVLVNYPIEMLEMRLRLPSGFAKSQPEIRCERMINLTDYKIDPQCDSVEVADDAQPIPDEALTGHVAQGLTWLAEEGRWRLRIRRPMVGYCYEMYWPLPDTPLDPTVRNDTRGWRDTLLEMERQLRDGKTPLPAHPAWQVFDELTHSLCAMLSGSVRDRRYAASLFVYDETSLALRPALSRKSWAETPFKHDFDIQLGDGIAGAAFQQCRAIAWANAPEQSRLLQPKRYPYEPGEDEGLERAILAIPVYHDHTLQPPSPWNAIGVVSYSSWGALSKIPTMGYPAASAFVAAVGGFTQIQFNRLRESVRLGHVPA
jgi:predicted phosphodiesterase